MSSATCRVACFDLGGVVVRIHRTFEEALRAAGLPVHHDLLPRLPLLAPLSDAYQSGVIDDHEYARLLTERLDHRYTPSDILRAHDAVILDPYEGVTAVIHAARAASLRIIALSNTNARHWKLIDHIEAIRAMDDHLLSHEIGAIKPHEAAFRAVERRADARPEEVLLFDDTPDNIDAARAAGWDAVLIDHTRETAPQLRAALQARDLLP